MSGLSVTNENLDLVKYIWENKRLKQISKALYKVKQVYTNILNTLHRKKSILYKNKDKIIDCVDKISQYFCKSKVLKLFDLTRQKYHSWKKILYSCSTSTIDKCFNIFPNQLTKKEISSIKKYLTNEKYLNWSSVSVYYLAIRDKTVLLTLTTWYKYARLLNLSRNHLMRKKNKKQIGIRSNSPAKIIHMDVTVYVLSDVTKVYIYLIIDNFSRFILNWKVSLECVARISFKNLKEAVEKYYPNRYKELIVDDGSENKKEVIDYVEERRKSKNY